MKKHSNILQTSRRVQFSILLLGALATAWADGGADHRATQARPIFLGTSGGNINDRSKIYCCSGTLGAAVEDAADAVYILSNNHVLGRVNQASPGEDVNQPGQIDQSCGQSGVVADFTRLIPIQFMKGKTVPLNEVDAAIAKARPGMVRTDGSILDIGPISSSIAAALPNQIVQKSGRTTGHTLGTVSDVNATVTVAYSQNCGGAANLKARFVNQIIVRDDPMTFSAGGDSGSVVLDVPGGGNAPRAVGLLFAGSPGYTIANPIGRVLELLQVSMIGGTVSPASGTGGGAAIARGAAASEPARAVQARHSDALFALDDVVGHGLGQSADGQPVIRVYVAKDNPGTRARVPVSLESVPVAVVVTGEFVAY